jgi:hypothetical protein
MVLTMLRQNQKRKGTAATECALCLPIIILFTLFSIEVCSVMFLKEAITIAAYEGGRVGIQRGGTDANVEFRVMEFLNERGIAYSDPVTISDPGFDNAGELEHVTTTVTVPVNGNLFSGWAGWVFDGMELEASVTMRKEFANPD